MRFLRVDPTSTLTSDHTDWRAKAACADMDPALFDIPNRGPEGPWPEALAACAACPVRRECRDDQLQSGHLIGSMIAGGWWWNARGVPTPYDTPEDWALMPASKREPVDGRLTVQEAADRLGISTQDVHNAIARGKLPSTKVGYYRRLDPADVDAYAVTLAAVPVAKCGTKAGYLRHLAAGDGACRLCAAAYREAEAYKAKRRAA